MAVASIGEARRGNPVRYTASLHNPHRTLKMSLALPSTSNVSNGWPRRFANAAGRWLFPPFCVLCATRGNDVCAACSHTLDAPLHPCCTQCALPLSAQVVSNVCGACLRDSPAYDRSVAASLYVAPFDQLVLDLKYRAQIALAPIFARLLATRLSTTIALPDVLIPVPLSSLRLAERGFNQASEIARPLGAYLGVPVRPAVLRIRHTHPQADLPFAARRKNMRNAFHVCTDIAGLRVALVDDVMTTGSTLNELARTLKRAGAREVVNLVVARTPRLQG